jgi:hypothetical protein
MLKDDLEHSWRWRESNPRPSVHHQGFSVRSSLCFSQPRRSRKLDADRLSRCSMSRLAPRPGQAVILLADARHRVEGIPGLTDLYFALSGESEVSARCVGTYWFTVTGLTRSQPQPSARFPWFNHRSRNRSPPVELYGRHGTCCRIRPYTYNLPEPTQIPRAVGPRRSRVLRADPVAGGSAVSRRGRTGTPRPARRRKGGTSCRTR